MWPTWRDNRPFALALLILIAYAIVFLWVETGQSIRETQQIGKPQPYEHSIVIDGVGTVSGKPDIATVSMGIDSRAEDVATAQTENSEKMNTLIAQVKAIGISEDDIQTTYYQVWQDTPWNPDTQTYEPGEWVVSQTVSIKVRDTSKISSVLQVAGQNGATNISGPNFEIDDPTNLKAEAREEAIADAEVKAKALAKSLGLKLDGVIGYSEYTPDSYPPYPYYAREASLSAVAPEIQPGTSDVTVNVTLTYKLVE